MVGAKGKRMSEKFEWLLFGWTLKKKMAYTKYGISKKEEEL